MFTLYIECSSQLPVNRFVYEASLQSSGVCVLPPGFIRPRYKVQKLTSVTKTDNRIPAVLTLKVLNF